MIISWRPLVSVVGVWSIYATCCDDDEEELFHPPACVLDDSLIKAETHGGITVFCYYRDGIVKRLQTIDDHDLEENYIRPKTPSHLILWMDKCGVKKVRLLQACFLCIMRQFDENLWVQPYAMMYRKMIFDNDFSGRLTFYEIELEINRTNVDIHVDSKPLVAAFCCLLRATWSMHIIQDFKYYIDRAIWLCSDDDTDALLTKIIQDAIPFYEIIL